jgi:hypothetical protein
MQQRQLRLGDILDDYCPRERRITNHVVVAMVGQDVKQTRCTTCDADHEYKHAKVPRPRKKPEALAGAPAPAVGGVSKKAPQEPIVADSAASAATTPGQDLTVAQNLSDLLTKKQADEERADAVPALEDSAVNQDEHDDDVEVAEVEGPVHRPLIRATLPRPEGQAPPQRPAPDFTIRQPGGRPGRFRPRNQRGGQFGHRSNGGMGGSPRHMGNRPPHGSRGAPPGASPSRPGRHQGRKRSK